MDNSMMLALCVDGVADGELVTAAKTWVPCFSKVEVWCAYGNLATRELANARERHGHAPHPPPPKHGPDPDREQADGIVQRGVELLRAQGIEAAPRALGGQDPGRALADASTPEIALFLSSGHHGGIGPKSFGHVARFVVDHARGPVIVVKI
jgi:hypothetical protein